MDCHRKCRGMLLGVVKSGNFKGGGGSNTRHFRVSLGKSGVDYICNMKNLWSEHEYIEESNQEKVI